MLVSTGGRCSLHAWSIKFIIAAGVLNGLELLIPNLKHAVKEDKRRRPHRAGARSGLEPKGQILNLGRHQCA
jgi:hypothetical protein